MSLKSKLLLASILLSSSSAFGDKKLLCSSETLELWYSYSGGMYYFSASCTPCFYGQRFDFTYTVIPLFQIRHFAYKASFWYNNKKWFEKSDNDAYYPQIKLFTILKGETLHDTVSFDFSYIFPKGVYEVFIDVINLDDDLKEKCQAHIRAIIR